MQAVDFINEENVALLQVREDACEVTGALDLRAAGRVQLRADRAGDEIGQRGLAEAGRAAEQHVIQRLTAHFGRLDHDEQLFLHLCLAVKLREVRRAECEVKRRVRFVERRIHRAAVMTWD